MLLGMKNQRWRDMRETLSPAFTGSKMRVMFDLITEYTDRMVQIVRTDLEMKDFFTRIANDTIATCAFGLKVESVQDRDDGEGLKFTIEKGACLWFPVHGILPRSE